MTSTPPICFTGSAGTLKSRKSHRMDVHKHADQYLAELEAKQALKNLPKAQKPSFVLTYLSYLGKGLEAMFKAINIRP